MEKTSLIYKAYSHFSIGEFSEARDCYEQILSTSPREKVAFNNSVRFMLELCSNRLQLVDNENFEIDLLNDVCSRAQILKRNRLILLVNASHAHLHEVTFWKEFIEKAGHEDFIVVDLAFRAVDSFSGNPTIVNPARAADLSRKYSKFYEYERPKWLSTHLTDHYVDWEHRRWQIDKYNPLVHKGIVSTGKYIDDLISTLNPCCIITTNKIDWPNNMAYEAAQYYGIEYFFMERSPLDSHILESKGMFSESERNRRLIEETIPSPRKQIDPRGLRLAESLKVNPYGFRADEASRAKLPDTIDTNKPVFFLPLDNIIWTGWGMNKAKQGRLDYPLYDEPSDAISELQTYINNLGGLLVVKPHPSCKEWQRLANLHPDVIFCDADLQLLIERADVVVTFLTKVSYVALAQEKPVISFGGGLLCDLGVTYQVGAYGKLEECLDGALKRVEFKEKVVKFINLLPRLESTFFNSGSRAFNYIFAESCSIRESTLAPEVLNLIDNIKPLGKKVSAEAYSLEPSKPTVLFDVTRLTNGSLWNSGISRYARSLIQGIQRTRLYNVVCGASFSKNEHGLSAYIVQKISDELGVELFEINKAFNRLEASGKKYIYHSPVNPDFVQNKYPNCLSVITIHDILHVTQKEIYDSSHTITPRIIDSVNHESTGVIFDSCFSQKDFESYTGKKVNNSSVVHLGVDETFKTTEPSLFNSCGKIINQDDVLLTIPYQGDPRKGFKRMMSIALEWLSFDSNRKLIVFGSSRNKDKFERILKAMVNTSVPNNVRYVANCTDSDLAALYRRSIATMYLSESEGFGLPPLEAMACGCPCILLSNTSLAEVYEGWPLMLPNNAKNEEISSVLSKLSSDNAYQKQLSLHAIRFSNSYDWGKTVNKTIAFYDRMLNISNN